MCNSKRLEEHLTATRVPRRRNFRAAAAGEFELVFQADPTIYDGSFANNGWLQELPKPITQLTWDNAALMSPATAKELGVEFGEYAHGGEHGGYYMPVVELKVDGRTCGPPRGSCRDTPIARSRCTWATVASSRDASAGCRKAAGSTTK